jgi:hypothetical protein
MLKYNDQQKQEIIEFVRNNSNKAAMRQYGIGRNTIKYWTNKNYRRMNIKGVSQHQNNNKEQHSLQTKKYFLKTKDKWHKWGAEYYQKNKSVLSKKIKDRHKKRLKTDPFYKLKDILRHRLHSALKNKKVIKNQHTIDLLGCSIEFFKTHLESKFKPDMNWENYGVFGWHIDHIIPCDSFDLTKIEEQRKCFHYNNLQPLWSTENWSKSNKVK